MEEYVKRMQNELKELHEKREKLESFIICQEANQTVPRESLDLLIFQNNSMKQYEDILRARLRLEGAL